MSLIDLLINRKKQAEEASNIDYEETPEQRKARLEKAMKESSGTYRNQ